MRGERKPAEITSGSSPLGATVYPAGTNFSVFSRNALGVDLLFFDREHNARPARVVCINHSTNRTYHYWHFFESGVRPRQVYGYRVEGPFHPANRLRFDPNEVLLDPYGRAVVVPRNYSRKGAMEPGDNAAAAMERVVADPRSSDWEGDTRLERPSFQTIVYEMHVRGFTRHLSSGFAEKVRRTYAGLIETIPYLSQLGITAVELMPVFQFDAQDCPPGQVNYWGDAPVSFFAPHRAFRSRQGPLSPVDEFCDLS